MFTSIILNLKVCIEEGHLNFICSDLSSDPGFDLPNMNLNICIEFEHDMKLYFHFYWIWRFTSISSAVTSRLIQSEMSEPTLRFPSNCSGIPSGFETMCLIFWIYKHNNDEDNTLVSRLDLILKSANTTILRIPWRNTRAGNFEVSTSYSAATASLLMLKCKVGFTSRDKFNIESISPLRIAEEEETGLWHNMCHWVHWSQLDASLFQLMIR